MDLGRQIENRLHNERRTRGPNVTGRNRDRIIDMLGKLPLPQVRDKTGLTYGTLVKIAQTAGL